MSVRLLMLPMALSLDTLQINLNHEVALVYLLDTLMNITPIVASIQKTSKKLYSWHVILLESHFPFKISIHKDSNPTKYATSNWYNSATSYTKSVPLHMNAPSTDFPFLNASFDQHLNFHKGNDAHEYPHTIVYVSQVQPHITPISPHNQQQSTHIEFLPPASNLPHMDMDNPANMTTEMDSHLPRINDASSIEPLQVSASLPSHLPSSNQDSKIITRSKNC